MSITHIKFILLIKSFVRYLQSGGVYFVNNYHDIARYYHFIALKKKRPHVIGGFYRTFVLFFTFRISEPVSFDNSPYRVVEIRLQLLERTRLFI